MSLNVIIGKSNSGKTEYIMNKIMACENELKQAILFVPSSGRIIAEEEYLKCTNKKALIDTRITSFERFVNINTDKTKLYSNKTFLKELTKKMMIKKVVSENAEEFKVFSKVKDTVGFIDKISAYVDRFDDLQDLEVLDKYETQDFLKTKLDEFRKIYNTIKFNLNEKFVAATDEMQEYIKYLSETSENVINSEVFIDNYNNFSKLEYDFIQALLLIGNNVYITLDLNKDEHLDGVTEIYGTSYDTLSNLKKLAATNGVDFKLIDLNIQKNNRPQEIAFLSNNIFNVYSQTYNKEVEAVKLILTSNTYNEIKYVAGDILAKIKEGYVYSDIAIYTNNLEMYSIFLKKIFGVYNIPLYINEQDKITNASIAVYLTNILKLIVNGLGKSIENILVLIKTGMLDLQEQDIHEFENYVLEFGIRGYNLVDEFKIAGTYNLDKINETREHILKAIHALKEGLNNVKTSKEITEVIYNYLIESNIIKKYEEQLLLIKKLDVNEYNKGKQVVSKLYEVMDNICLAYDKIATKDYLELFEYGVKEITIDTIPAKVNQVEVIDINKSRGLEKKVAYIIGCYDGGLPTVQSEDSIFTDVELEKLKALGIDLRQTSYERQNMQLFNIYQTLNKVRDQLIITVPSSMTSGASLRESSLVQDIKRVLNIELQSVEKGKTHNIDDNFMEFIQRISEINEDTSKKQAEEIYTNYLLYKDIEKYNSILNYERQDKNLESNTINMVYKDKINSSVSRLEQFERCPFAYYTKYVLNLKEPKAYEMSNLDTGSFMHEVIEKFSKYIVAKNIAWQDIIIDEKIASHANIKIDEIVDKIFDEEYSKYLSSNKYIVLRSKMKKTMKRTIFAIADSFNHSEFRPLGYEIEFDKDALFAPIEVELDNGKKLLLRGKIDRIDSLQLEDSTYLRIVDYKSSEKNLKLSDIKMGISLQLMTYMWAMMENKEKLATKKVIPAALSYFTISNKILSIPNYESNDSKILAEVKKTLKLKGIYIKDMEILKKLDNNVSDSKNSYIEVSNRTFNNSEKVLSEEVFIEECKNVSKILKSIGTEITKGKVKIEPNKNIKNTCEYCSYSTVCRKNILN